MPKPLPTRLLHVTIERAVQDVYRFVANPENMPKWASGLGKGIRQVDGKWFADTPEGKLEVRFAPANDFGVLDPRGDPGVGRRRRHPHARSGQRRRLRADLYSVPPARDER